MQTVNIHAAKTHLSRLLEEAAAGEEIIIAKAGNPVAKLGPLATTTGRKRRRLGLLAGRVKVPKNFDAPLPLDILDSFEGR
jgi:prevent-host-death family protein